MNIKTILSSPIKKSFFYYLALWLMVCQGQYMWYVSLGDSQYWVNTYLKYHPELGWSTGLICHMFIHNDLLHLSGSLFILISLVFYDKPNNDKPKKSYWMSDWLCYLICYLICGLCGALAITVFHTYIFPLAGYALGSSSAIFGLMAFTLLGKHGHITYALLFFWALWVIGLLASDAPSFSHLIGYYSGLVMGMLYRYNSIS